MSVVLPIPGSPLTKTICRAPLAACSRHARSSSISRSRPTTSGAGLGRAGAGVPPVARGWTRAAKR